MALVVILACLGLVACGGGGSDDSLDDPVGDTRAPGDQGAAEAANLRISDFPDEWRATPVPADSTTAADAGARILAECMGRPAPETLRTAIAYSEDFASLDTRRVSSSVQLVRTPEAAVDDFVALRADRAPECHKASVDAEFRRQQPGVPIGTTIERLDLPTFGDETAGFRVAATITDDRGQTRIYIDLVFARKGRTELSANFLNRGTPFPTELQRTLLQRMVSRA